jgi:hypothetical protein
MHRMKGMRSKASAGGMDIDFGDQLYNDAIDIGDPDVPMMEGDPTEKVFCVRIYIMSYLLCTFGEARALLLSFHPWYCCHHLLSINRRILREAGTTKPA